MAFPKASATLALFAAQFEDEKAGQSARVLPDDAATRALGVANRVVTPQEAGWAAAQLLTPALVGKAVPILEAAFGKQVANAAVKAVANGEEPSAALSAGFATGRAAIRGAGGAAIGAAFSPDDLRAGAIIGGAIGGAHGAVTPARFYGDVPVSAPADYEGQYEVVREPKLLTAGEGERPPAATSPAPMEPDFEVFGERPPVSREAPTVPRETGTSNAGVVPAVETVKGAKDILKQAKDLGERRDLESRANTDALTGLGNSHAFQQVLPRVEADPNTSVIRWDMNNFKAFNDEFGHKAGDEILKEAAKAVRDAAGERSSFRHGGDEFQGVAPNENAEQVARAAEQAFGVREFRTKDGKTIKVSISGGVGPTDVEADAAAKAQKALHKAQQGIPLTREEQAAALQQNAPQQPPEAPAAAAPEPQARDLSPAEALLQNKEEMATKAVQLEKDISNATAKYDKYSNSTILAFPGGGTFLYDGNMPVEQARKAYRDWALKNLPWFPRGLEAAGETPTPPSGGTPSGSSLGTNLFPEKKAAESSDRRTPESGR